MIRNGVSKVIVPFLENIAQGGGKPDPLTHRKGQPMGLARPVVRVLAHNHHTHPVWRRQFQRFEPFCLGWQNGMARLLLVQKMS